VIGLNSSYWLFTKIGISLELSKTRTAPVY
jgi:hypothetical protein